MSDITGQDYSEETRNNKRLRKAFEEMNSKEDHEFKQVGGKHYLNKIEPWYIIDSWGLNFYEGNILKYLLRRKGNRVEDLQKLIHYAEKLIELSTSPTITK